MFLLNRCAEKNAPGRPLTPAPIPHTVPLMVATLNNFVWHDQFKTSALAEEERTGANRANGEGKEILCSLCSLLFKSGPGGVVELDFDKSISDGVNIYAKRDGDADFVFLACRADLSRRSWTKAEVRRRRALH